VITNILYSKDVGSFVFFVLEGGQAKDQDGRAYRCEANEPVLGTFLLLLQGEVLLGVCLVAG